MLHSNVLVFKILRLLQEKNIPLPEDSISESLEISKEEFDRVRSSIVGNARIEYEAGYYRYRPLFKIQSVDDVCGILKAHPSSGIRSEDIQVHSVLSELRKASGGVSDFIVVDTKGNNFVVFLNDIYCKQASMELRLMWKEAFKPSLSIGSVLAPGDLKPQPL